MSFWSAHFSEVSLVKNLTPKEAIKSALKLRAHSVQYAYRLAAPDALFENNCLDSHHQFQARASASNPPDPHYINYQS
eukprot:1144073-Pelagomonas_calceolata.AAC.5